MCEYLTYQLKVNSGTYTCPIPIPVDSTPFKKVIWTFFDDIDDEDPGEEERFYFMIHPQLEAKVRIPVYRSATTEDMPFLVNQILDFNASFVFSTLECKYIPTSDFDLVDKTLRLLDEKFSNSIIDICIVCHEDTVIRTNCGHALCTICHTQLKKLECPVCRNNIGSVTHSRYQVSRNGYYTNNVNIY